MFLFIQVALDVKGSSLSIGLISPNSFQLFLEKNLSVKLRLLDGTLEAGDLLALHHTYLSDSLGEGLECPGSCPLITFRKI